MIGPRDDGYSAGQRLDPAEAAEYHRPQLEAFASAHADMAAAYTLTDVGEATGIVQAARAAGLPIAISFTVETDGRLPSGTTIGDAIAAVDQAAPPDYYLINCAHPIHIARGLGDDGPWRRRIAGIRPNASTRSHAELDEADQLDEGDTDVLVAAQARLARKLPGPLDPRRLLRDRPPARRRALGRPGALTCRMPAVTCLGRISRTAGPRAVPAPDDARRRNEQIRK